MSSGGARDGFDQVTEAFQPRSCRQIRLGPVRVDIRSNESHFRGFRFFSETGPAASDLVARPDFTLSLCNLRVDAPWPLDTLVAMRDASYRGKKMSAGYYLTDHYGSPAYLVTRGTHLWIFAEDFEPILWPYAVKHLLTVYSMQHGMLHVKAAAVAIDGQGMLLVGRGGSGKTVLLTRLCQTGAQFLSNTHALIDGQQLLGIATAMRVRPDEFFASIIEERRLSPSVKVGEYTANPLTDLGWSTLPAALIRAICLVDYKKMGLATIREIHRETLFDYMEQFALAINVYGLKEDILDTLGVDVNRFSEQMSQMRTRLHALVDGARCYYLSCDAADPRNLRSVRGLLQES